MKKHHKLSRKTQFILLGAVFLVWLYVYTGPLKGDTSTGMYTFLNQTIFTLAIMNTPAILLI